MRFHGLDLNLLVALDALLTHQNVTRAAEQLNLSQSALSGCGPCAGRRPRRATPWPLDHPPLALR